MVETRKRSGQAGLAEKFADGCDARVVGDLEDGAGHFVVLLELLFQLLGVADHGAKLEHGEGFAVKGMTSRLEIALPFHSAMNNLK